MKLTKVAILSIFFISGITSVGTASVDQLKAYRQVYPDFKPSCTYCHVDKTPKKEEGKHELSLYGAKVQEMIHAQEKKLTKEELEAICIKVFQELGRHDEFKPADAAATEDNINK